MLVFVVVAIRLLLAWAAVLGCWVQLLLLLWPKVSEPGACSDTDEDWHLRQGSCGLLTVFVVWCFANSSTYLMSFVRVPVRVCNVDVLWLSRPRWFTIRGFPLLSLRCGKERPTPLAVVLIKMLLVKLNVFMCWFHVCCSDAVMACAWNPSGRSLISCDKHKTVILWSD